MPSTPAIDFIVLYVSDLEASLAYFTQELGFGHDPAQNTPEFRNLVDGQRNIGFGLVQATEATPKPGSVELYFKTDDLEGLRSSYISKGIEPTAIVHQPFGSIFSVQPPDGLMVIMLGEPER
jgi:catechol 2,3-dioxygenase-like lactoylglutathione lyase family enzyme